MARNGFAESQQLIEQLKERTSIAFRPMLRNGCSSEDLDDFLKVFTDQRKAQALLVAALCPLDAWLDYRSRNPLLEYPLSRNPHRSELLNTLHEILRIASTSSETRVDRETVAHIRTVIAHEREERRRRAKEAQRRKATERQTKTKKPVRVVAHV